MYGYWKNPNRGSSNNNPGGGGAVAIGLPPLLRPTNGGAFTEGLFLQPGGSDWTTLNLSNNLIVKKKTLKGTYGGIQIGSRWYPDLSGDYYMYLPSSFYGYITNAVDLPGGTAYKTALDTSMLSSTAITSQDVYAIGIDAYRITQPPDNFYNLGTNPGEDALNAGDLFLREIFDATNIPVFTGSFRTGGGSPQENLYKQNRHYAAIRGGAGGMDLLDAGLMPRYLIKGNNFYNTATLGSGAMDTQFSCGSAEGGILRSGYTTLPATYRVICDWGTSGTYNNILPWGVDFCGCFRVTYNATNGNIIDTLRPRITPYTSRANGNFNFDIVNDAVMVGNTGNNLYSTRYGYNTDDNRTHVAMPLPSLPRNSKIYGGVGNGVLDAPIINTYVQPGEGWSFPASNPGRYCFCKIEYLNNYSRYCAREFTFIVMYFTNNVITITT